MLSWFFRRRFTTTLFLAGSATALAGFAFTIVAALFLPYSIMVAAVLVTLVGAALACAAVCWHLHGNKTASFKDMFFTKKPAEETSTRFLNQRLQPTPVKAPATTMSSQTETLSDRVVSLVKQGKSGLFTTKRDRATVLENARKRYKMK